MSTKNFDLQVSAGGTGKRSVTMTRQERMFHMSDTSPYLQLNRLPKINRVLLASVQQTSGEGSALSPLHNTSIYKTQITEHVIESRNLKEKKKKKNGDSGSSSQREGFRIRRAKN